MEVYTDLFVTVVRRTTEEMELWDLLTGPFLPFEATLWLAIFGSIVLSATVLWHVEGGSFRHNPVEGILGCVHALLLTYVRCAPCNKAATPAGRLTVIGFGLFVLITLSSYTANLAANLTVKAHDQAVTSLDGAIKERWKVCGHTLLTQTIHQLYPPMQQLFVPQPTDLASLASMDTGKCQMAVVSQDLWDVAVSGIGTGDPTQHCDKIVVGDVAFSLMIALPVQPEFQRALTYLMTKGINEGSYSRKAEDYKRRRVPASSCPEADGMKKSKRLTVKYFADPLLVSTLCSMIAFIFSMCDEQKEVKGYLRKLRAKESRLRHSHSRSRPLDASYEYTEDVLYTGSVRPQQPACNQTEAPAATLSKR